MNYPKILKFEILKTFNTDRVYAYFDAPYPITYDPSFKNCNLDMHFETPPNKGEEYIKTNFPGIPYNIKNAR